MTTTIELKNNAHFINVYTWCVSRFGTPDWITYPCPEITSNNRWSCEKCSAGVRIKFQNDEDATLFFLKWGNDGKPH